MLYRHDLNEDDYFAFEDVKRILDYRRKKCER